MIFYYLIALLIGIVPGIALSLTYSPGSAFVLASIFGMLVAWPIYASLRLNRRFGEWFGFDAGKGVAGKLSFVRRVFIFTGPWSFIVCHFVISGGVVISGWWMAFVISVVVGAKDSGAGEWQSDDIDIIDGYFISKKWGDS